MADIARINEHINELSEPLTARETIRLIAEDLRNFAEWEYHQKVHTGHGVFYLHRRRTLEYAADYIERAADGR